MIRGIHHLAINTGNFDRMVTFYRDAFGFLPVTDEISWSDNALVDTIIGVPGSAARTVMLKAGNVYLEVFEYLSPPARHSAPLRPNDRGYTHFALDTDDIEADYHRLIGAGMTFVRSIPDDIGGIRAVYGKDLDGNVIELQRVDHLHNTAFEKLSLNSKI